VMLPVNGAAAVSFVLGGEFDLLQAASADRHRSINFIVIAVTVASAALTVKAAGTARISRECRAAPRREKAKDDQHRMHIAALPSTSGATI